MNIDGIDPSQIEALKTSFLEPQTREPIQPPKAEDVQAETLKVEQLALQARELPENRPDVVERGRELLNDPNYPSAEVMDQVAEILMGVAEERF